LTCSFDDSEGATWTYSISFTKSGNAIIGQGTLVASFPDRENIPAFTLTYEIMMKKG